MTFSVSRTSGYRSSDNPPCEKARQRIDSYGSKYWEVEIETLEELISLVKKEKHEIIVNGGFMDDKPELEIYDTYRE